MRNPKEDRRVRRTQKLLKESLVQLMSEKAFKDITIKDITERADLNRGTFYLHYSDTYDLLTAMENGVLEDFQEMITAYMPSRPGNGLMPVLLPIVHYIVENEQICKNLFENNVSNEFVTKFKELIRKNGGALIERLYPACQTADSEYFFEFITYGLIGIIKNGWTTECPRPRRRSPHVQRRRPFPGPVLFCGMIFPGRSVSCAFPLSGRPVPSREFPVFSGNFPGIFLFSS